MKFDKREDKMKNTKLNKECTEILRQIIFHSPGLIDEDFYTQDDFELDHFEIIFLLKRLLRANPILLEEYHFNEWGK